MMRHAPAAPLLLPVVLGACGVPAPPPVPPSLGYDAVTEPEAVYVYGDTARVEVDAGGRTVEARVSTAATLDLEFRPSPGGLTVSARFREFSARETNPLGAGRTAGDDGIDGALVFVLDPRGEPTLMSSPELGAGVAHFLSPEATVATLFPRLPGRAVRVGDRWTDTVRLDARRAGTRVTGTSVVTYTAVGDTTLEGRSHLRVELEATDHRELSGSESGMDVSRSLDGGSTGWFLWDLSRGLLRACVHESDLRGTMEVGETPFPLSLRVRSRAEVRLVEVPAG